MTEGWEKGLRAFKDQAGVETHWPGRQVGRQEPGRHFSIPRGLGGLWGKWTERNYSGSSEIGIKVGA